MTAVNTEVSNQLGTNFTVQPYAQEAYQAAQPTVAWTTAPSVTGKTETSVTIGFASDNNNGEIACIVLNERSQTEYET